MIHKQATSDIVLVVNSHELDDPALRLGVRLYVALGRRQVGMTG
jgi:hypothetical protein